MPDLDMMGGGMPQKPDNHEAAMARADLYKAANYSFKLFKMIQDGQELEGWVQAKITKAADYIASVYHYMEYEMKFNDYGKKLEDSDIYTEDVKQKFIHKLTEARVKLEKLRKKNIKDMKEDAKGDWDSMEKSVKDRADKEKGTGKFDVKKTSTGTQYTRKASTFTDGGKDKDLKKAEKKAAEAVEQPQGLGTRKVTGKVVPAGPAPGIPPQIKSKRPTKNAPSLTPQHVNDPTVNEGNKMSRQHGRSVKEQGVAEGSEWETRHDEFVTIGDRATPELINKIVNDLTDAAKKASGKRGFLNQILGKQSNGDLARMAHSAEILAKNIKRNSRAKPGSDERKELGQHLSYAVSLLKRMGGEQQGVAEGSLNELSKDTLKAYAKKAVPDMQASQKRSEIEAGKAASTKDDETAKTHYDAAKQAKDRTEKRMAGISGAIKRVNKEGVAEGSKPDFLDMDKDGNRKEPMKKAVADKKKMPFGKKTESVVAEKAVSKAQQKFFGMVHAAKKGKKPASTEVAKTAKSISGKEAEKFASTKHRGLPDKK